MIVLWLAVGLLAGASEAPPDNAVGGGGKQTFEQARQQYDAKKSRSVQSLIDSLEPERPKKLPKPKTVPVVQSSATRIVDSLIGLAAAPLDILGSDVGPLLAAERMAAEIEMTPVAAPEIQEDHEAISMIMMLLEFT